MTPRPLLVAGKPHIALKYMEVIDGVNPVPITITNYRQKSGRSLTLLINREGLHFLNIEKHRRYEGHGRLTSPWRGVWRERAPPWTPTTAR